MTAARVTRLLWRAARGGGASRKGPRILALLLCAAGVGCAEPSSPLEGVWQSDRAATLAALEAHGGFDERQWEALRDPELFGHMVQVFRGARSFVIFDGECSDWLPLEIEETTECRLRIGYLDERGEHQERTLTVSGDRLLVPIRSLDGTHEVFARIPAADVARRHPCLTERLAEPRAGIPYPPR